MRMRSFAIAGAALGLAAAPLAAETLRSAAPVKAANALEGNSEVFYVLGAAAVIAAIIIAVGGDDDPISG